MKTTARDTGLACGPVRVGAKSILLMSKMDYTPIHEHPRYLAPAVEKALAAGKMAFVGGPRQVGKTTLALSLLGPEATERHPAYFNWDDPRSAARLRRVELPAREPLLVFDEVHKYARWRNLLKGIYDTEKSFAAHRRHRVGPARLLPQGRRLARQPLPPLPPAPVLPA